MKSRSQENTWRLIPTMQPSAGDRVMWIPEEDDVLNWGVMAAFDDDDPFFEDYFPILTDGSGEYHGSNGDYRISRSSSFFIVHPDCKKLCYSNCSRFIRVHDWIEIDNSIWGQIKEIRYSIDPNLTEKEFLTNCGLVLGVGLYNGSFEDKFCSFGSFDKVDPYMAFLDDGYTPIFVNAIVSINHGEIFGCVFAVILPSSPLLKKLGFPCKGGLLLQWRGSTEKVLWETIKTIRYRGFAQYYDTCEWIKERDVVFISTMLTLKDRFTSCVYKGVVLKICWAYSEDSEKFNAISTGGLLLKINGKKHFIHWENDLWISHTEEIKSVPHEYCYLPQC